MSEYSHCSICGGSFVGIGNVCPGCEHALSREPLEIRQVERQTRNNSEPLRDIISEARGVLDELLKHGYKVVSIDRMADIIDRIIAAHDREISDEKRISDAVVQSLRDKKLEMAGEIAAKEAEVAALRALVKEIADVLNETKNYTCFGCTIRDCPGEHECRYTQKYCLLVAKAREVIGGKAR